MSFIQDPRLRQRWNQLSHNAEAATENAAAGIWNFQHRYVSPCLASVADSLDGCAALCLGGGRDERARRARERDRGARRGRAEAVFDFYDDWDDDDLGVIGGGGDGGGGGGGYGDGDDLDGGGEGGGLWGRWAGGRAEDWDRLLAGTGAGRGRHSAGVGAGDVVEQPRRKRGMSYGTRGTRRKASGQEDPTIIPSTTPLGFLGRLPFKIGGTLRYKPSAANLRDHPGAPVHHRPEEADPLLGTAGDDGEGRLKRSPPLRARSNTAGSGGTSDSYRSRNDLFPSDGEGDEDAIPLDDEFDVALDRVDDRGSSKTRSSKGKRRADGPMSRTVSRSTVSSSQTAGGSIRERASSTSIHAMGEPKAPPSLEDLRREEEEARREEDAELERRRRAASRLALERGLSRDNLITGSVPETRAELVRVHDMPQPSIAEPGDIDDEELDLEDPHNAGPPEVDRIPGAPVPSNDRFVPARLPHFR
ncbi:hypothetical protein QBC33DRAFT_556020 [Phialemonium atrogriseum]|uniref:Uncharacterized protein n=1 Tax=Phialemonium atrogriseum TaxID=1093897 RepID=A0AAJ0C5I0_9PEZI|nr:uncharacterized protein QBC33DRAFT_556020 [Phialemonium atrogriseum]KAK1770543.1 hypothetical protein QBC33DRAFT_556020 [Phialemonium atrogriseum]